MEIEEIKAALDQRDAAIEVKLAALEELETKNEELTHQVASLEQKVAEGFSGSVVVTTNNGPMLGKAITDNERFKNFVDGSMPEAKFEVKTAIVNATGQNQPLVPSDRIAGIVHGANREFRMRDLLAVGVTNSNMVEYAKENVFTNNAGPQVGNSPEEFENVTKPESAISFTLQNQAVTTLAHWIPVSKQVLSDSPALQSFVNSRLLYGLKFKEDTQILLGTGANGELPGLYTNRTAYSTTSPLAYTSKIDIIRDAMDQVQTSDYQPNGIVLHPTDWKEIQLTKVGSSDDRYVVGNAVDSNETKLWGLPVVVTNSMTAGTFLVGAFDMAAQLWDRENATITAGWKDDDLVKNMVTILCEERLALTVYRSDAIVGGSFTVS